MLVRFARMLLPPIWFVVAVAIQISLHLLLPLHRLQSGLLLIAGIAIMLGGMILILISARAFRAAQTPIKPFSQSSSLVSVAAYRRTRNPMYLGMLIMLIGAAISLQSFSAILVVPLFFILIDHGYVRGEEAFLEEIFGEEYRALKNSVPRWL